MDATLSNGVTKLMDAVIVDTNSVQPTEAQASPATKQDSSPGMKHDNRPNVKHELSATAMSPSRDIREGSTAASETDDPSEKLARELQAQEHGLRRRASVRTN